MTPLPVKIVGLGRYLPNRIVTNQEVESLCNLPTGWIEAKTGVKERRWVEDESQAFMAAQATQEALAVAGLGLNDIDLIINASGTQDQAIPDGGPLLQQALGPDVSGVPCYSVHATCLSFIVALELAATLLVSQRYKTILIVSAEIVSQGLNFAEPESASLLGDAAGAAIVRLATAGEASAIQSIHLETYAEGAKFAEVRGGGSQFPPNASTTQLTDNLFHMNGPNLLRLTRRYLSDFLEKLQPGLSTGLGDIQLVIPHQASLLGLRMLRQFGWPDEQVMIVLDKIGNCVAASIPLALYEAVAQQRVQRGDKLLLAGSGAGVSLGGIVLIY